MFGIQISARDTKFWTRVEQGILLLSRINDEDISSERAKAAIRRQFNSQLEACFSMLEAWCHIAITAKAMLDMGFEFEPWWEQRFISAHEHIIDNCVMLLGQNDRNAFDNNYETIFSNALHTSPHTTVHGAVVELSYNEGWMKDFI